MSSLDLTNGYATRLRDYRFREALTQAELAAKLGVSVRTVQAWEATAASVPQARHRRALRLLLDGTNGDEAAV